MQYAADVLAQLCDEVDSADMIDSFLLEAFKDAEIDLQDAVDRRIAFDRWVKIQVEATKEGLRYYAERRQLLEAVHERFKAKTKEILEARPDLPYSGRLGKITLAGNGGQQTIDYAFGDKKISPEAAALFGVPADYVIATYAIDSERVRAELEAGKTLGWASLADRGTHVRFPQNKKPKTLEDKK